MIEIQDLHKSFRDEHVLGGVDLQIHTGKTVAVIGRSGTGKSV